MNVDGFEDLYRQFREMAGKGKALRANVNRCPRCGGEHKRILFDYRPHETRKFTHVGTCPIKGGLIFLTRTKGKGAKLV